MIGFEAMERDVAQRLVDAGAMPNLARLQREGVTASMTNPIGMLTNPVWPTIVTGVHPDRHGYVTYRVLRHGTYRHEFLGVHPELTPPPFWRRLADQGLSCLVLDVPTVALEEHPRITHVNDWLTHERTSTMSSAPPHVARALQDRFGPAEVDRCDERQQRGELEELRTKLFADIESFATALPWLVQQSDFDVVVAASGTAHCAGHQFWHVHDERSVHFDPAARSTLGDVVSDVYRALDVALGRALELTTPDTTVAVVLSHGMGDNTMSPHLIDPVARAIDDAMGRAGAWHRTREFLRRAPNRAARLLTKRLTRAIEATYLADGSRRFLPVENFPCFGALRLNVIGREPNGRVAPSEMSATIDHLEAELLALRDADTGGAAVRRVIRTADHYDNVDGSGMADVLVEWVDDTAVEAVTSPTIGTIRRPSGEFRTGTHRQDGLAILWGPQFPAGVRAEMQSVDLWPTLAEALGVDAGTVDGTVLPVAASSMHRAT